MTLAQILERIDSRYPNGASVSDKVNYINQGQDELWKFGNLVEDVTTLVTVANQERYNYPALLRDVSDIIMLEIALIDTPVLDSDWQEYRLSPMLDKTRGGYVFYDAFSVGTQKQFGVHPLPTTAGLKFRIRYRKPLTAMSVSAMNASPDFDERFHDVLVSYACNKICTSTAYPDEGMANIFAREYNESEEKLYEMYGIRKARSPQRRKDNSTWHGTNARRTWY